MHHLFICVFVIIYFHKVVTLATPRRTPRSLQWSTVFSFSLFFLSLLSSPRTRLQYAMSIPHSTQYNLEHALNYFLINASSISIPFIFESLNAICGNTGPGPMQRHIHLNQLGLAHATDSLCGNRYCRWAHMQGIPPLRSLFHLRPRSSLPPRRAL
jgi:hypothetical protein